MKVHPNGLHPLETVTARGPRRKASLFANTLGGCVRSVFGSMRTQVVLRGPEVPHSNVVWIVIDPQVAESGVVTERQEVQVRDVRMRWSERIDL